MENAKYDHSGKDLKNHKSKDNFTDYFDYFYKTVQIDNGVYDIIINLKKQYGTDNGYTYTIKVRNNNKIKAAPALTGKSQLSMEQGLLNNNKIPHLSSKVNSENENNEKFSMKSKLKELNDEYMDLVKNSKIKRSELETFLNDLVYEAANIAFKNSKVRYPDGDLAEVYHGRTNIFTVFDRQYSEIEGDMGKGFYFSDDMNDVIEHYANENGDDLITKIEKLADKISNKEEIDYEEAKKKAEEKYIKTEANMLTVYLNIENPAEIAKDGKGTFLEYNENYDEETDEYGEPEGNLIDFVEALEQNSVNYFDSYRTPDFWAVLGDSIYDGGIYLSEAIKLLKYNIIDDITDENGDIAINEVIRLSLEDMGYDGIIDRSVSKKFTGMHLAPYTTHYIVFNSEQIKSADPITYDNDGNIIPLTERFNLENEDIRFSEKIPTIDLTKNNYLSNEIGNIKGANKYKIISNYILSAFSGNSIIFKDGLTAIVDKRDAMHIANKSADKKTAEIAEIKALIKKSVPYAEDNEVEHSKFNYFKYYVANVKYGKDTFPIFLNVGKGKYDGKYHLYDITHKIKDTAHRFNDVERPQGLRSASDVFSNEIIVGKDNNVNEILFSEKTDDTIKEQLKSHSAELDKMDSVFSIEKTDEFSSGKNALDWVMEKLKGYGKLIARQGFGNVELDKKRIRNGFSYFTPYDKHLNEIIAFAAVPKVIKQGIDVGYHNKHKNREYDTITFAAPITINGTRNNMAVVVRIEGKKYYKVHRVVLPDGSQLIFEQNKKDIAQTAGRNGEHYGLSPTANVFSNEIIVEKDNNVNEVLFSEKTDGNNKKYWKIEETKDVLKGLKTVSEYEKAAFDYILGERDRKTVIHAIDGKEMSFIRLSAEEFTNSRESRNLKNNNSKQYIQKMRMIPSLQDIVSHASVNWKSQDLKSHKLFKENGFENYRGRVGIDDVIFNYVVRAGKTSFGDVFYDINLEVDQFLPHTKSASEIKKGSTSENNISLNPENVKPDLFSTKEIRTDIDIDVAEEYIKINKELEKENAKLKELVKLQRERTRQQGQITNDKIIRPSSISAQATVLKKKYGISGIKGNTELEALLKTYYDYVINHADTDDITLFTLEQTMRQAKPVSDWIISKIEDKQQLNSAYDELNALNDIDLERAIRYIEVYRSTVVGVYTKSYK